jgi:5-methyltetrahydrofolate--homocysteine methyltransferase
VRQLRDFDLAEIAKFIDWTFFFSAWELRGKYPGILDNPTIGPAARELFGNGQALLQRIIDEKLLRANAVYGFWPAASVGDDIVLYQDETRDTELVRFPMLRQQRTRQGERGYLSLADFVAPEGSGVLDYVGAFAVTTGIGERELADRFEKAHDDYNSIMVKSLADRLAEAFAELLHQRVRREWGYAREEDLSNAELIAERYRGIRPAFGYPACPDHTPKGDLFKLLGAPEVGIELTESYAMMPGSSVSGMYLAHPEARYFNLGLIDRDQVADYAQRSVSSVKEVERWLSPNLGYDP